MKDYLRSKCREAKQAKRFSKEKRVGQQTRFPRAAQGLFKPNNRKRLLRVPVAGNEKANVERPNGNARKIEKIAV